MDELNITPMDIYNENEDDLDIDTIVYYLLKGGELDEVPEIFITQELFKEYVTRGGMLINVPRKFITQELFNDYFYRNFNSSTFLLDMPEDIITENMIKFFIKNTKEKEWIKYIPKSHITDNIKERYIESIGGINEYINNLIEIIKKFKKIELNEYLEIVPQKYIEDVCSTLLTEFKSKIELPKSYITENVKEKVFLALGGLDTFIDYFVVDEHEYLFRRYFDFDFDEFRFMENIIPNKYRKIICEKIFEKKHKIIDDILIDYWTEDMIKESIKTTKSIPRFVTDNPEKYLNILLYYYELTGNLREIPLGYEEKVLNLYIAKYNDIEKRAKDGDIDYLLTIYMTTKNINLIPPEFHEEVYKAYLFKYNSINGIPERYLMSICTDFFQSNHYKDIKDTKSIDGVYYGKYKVRSNKYPIGYEEFIQNHFADTYSLEEIPYIFGHRSISVKAYYDKIGGPDNIPEEKKEELFKYIFNRTFDLNLIPKKYITKEMIDNYYVQGYYNQIDRIPTNLLTEEVCRKYIDHTNKISTISPAFIKKHPKIYIYYLNKNFNVRSIPKQLLSREICLEYIITQKRLPINCEEFLKDNPDIYLEYFNHTGDIRSIPEEFRNDDIISRYIRNGGNLSDISNGYLISHPNLYIESFNVTHDLKNIPEEYITETMCYTYLNYHGDEESAFRYIPEKLKSNAYDWLVKTKGRLDLVPDEYKTKDMCDTIFSKDNNIEHIPERFLTEEMCEIYFEKYCLEPDTFSENIYNIPVKYMNDDMIDYIMGESDLPLKDMPTKIKMIVIKHELFNIKPGTKKYEISYKLGVGNYLVDKALEEIKQNNPEEYEKIQKVFKKNSAAMFAVYMKHIKALEEIILSLGHLSNKLTKEQQIKFSYLLGQEHLYYSLQNISDKILAGKGKEVSPVVNKFIQRYLGIGAKKKINSSKTRLSYDEYYAAAWGANWLKYFRFDEKFKNVNGKITTIKYIGEDGSQIEITKEMAEKIISILIENDIQPINCIVNAALLSYAGGNLEQLITQIKSYNNYKSETEKNARTR